MATTVTRGNFATITFINNGVLSQSQSPWYEFERTVLKTNTIRRVRPVDPFRNGTPLFHQHAEHYTTYGRFQASASTLIVAPCQYWVAAGAPSSTLPGDISGVQARLRAKVKAQNLNLAQSVAEYRQTASLFTGLCTDILRTFRSLRSGRAFADFVRTLQRPRTVNERAIANRWLRYQYGWRPLMSDIYGSIDACIKKIREGQFLHVRSSITERKELIDNFGQLPYSRSWVFETTTRGKARYLVKDATLKSLAQCGISNPLLLGWELIPYSFVVDWLFPVGEYLSALDALNGTSDLCVVTSVDQRWRCVASAHGGSHTYTNREYSRQGVVTGLAMPKLGYQPSKSLTAVLNGLALLSQFRTGR